MSKLAVYFRPRNQAQGQEIPAERLSRVRQSLRRRLSDQVEETFYRACAENDIRTAAFLYATIEDMNTRRQQQHGRERRISDQAVAEAREALNRVRALAQLSNQPPAAAETWQEAS
jgi:hypothetical protein